jgi:hypothetical protein
LPDVTGARDTDPYPYPYFSRYLRTGPRPYASAVDTERRPLTDAEPAALRDAADILARTTADEADAIAARDRFRSEGQPPIDADPEIGGRLLPGERLIEVRAAAMLGLGPLAGGAAVESLSGRLYVTTARLILLARPIADEATDADPELTVALADIDELAVVGERLLVSLADGTGLTIDAGRPRLLRVQIAAARVTSRSESRSAALEEQHAPSGDAFGLSPAILPLEA